MVYVQRERERGQNRARDSEGKEGRKRRVKKCQLKWTQQTRVRAVHSTGVSEREEGRGGDKSRRLYAHGYPLDSLLRYPLKGKTVKRGQTEVFPLSYSFVRPFPHRSDPSQPSAEKESRKFHTHTHMRNPIPVIGPFKQEEEEGPWPGPARRHQRTISGGKVFSTLRKGGKKEGVQEL